MVCSLLLKYRLSQKCILDYKTNIRPEVDPSIPDEMATAAGFEVDADPALCSAIQVTHIHDLLH